MRKSIALFTALIFSAVLMIVIVTTIVASAVTGSAPTGDPRIIVQQEEPQAPAPADLSAH